MHDCLNCGETCDCDGEDHHQSAPDDCNHDCDPEDDNADDRDWRDGEFRYD